MLGMSIVPDMVGIVVTDIPRAVRFYRLLGLPFADPKDDEDFVEVSVNGYRISLNAEKLVKTLHDDWVKPEGQRHEIAFKCGSPSEVDAVYAQVTAAGHRGIKEPWDAFWGQRYAVVEDPDGAHVSLFAAL